MKAQGIRARRTTSTYGYGISSDPIYAVWGKPTKKQIPLADSVSLLESQIIVCRQLEEHQDSKPYRLTPKQKPCNVSGLWGCSSAGEHRVRNAGVEGSNPFISTKEFIQRIRMLCLVGGILIFFVRAALYTFCTRFLVCYLFPL